MSTIASRAGLARVPRLFVAAPLHAGATVPANEAQAHYLLTVMRCGPGARVVLFNGRDGAWTATLSPDGRRRANLIVDDPCAPQDTAVKPILLFAPIKAQRLEFLIEKATELGVGVLMPVLTRRTIVSRVNADRLRAIAVEGAEQSERTTVPEVREALPLDQVMADWPTSCPVVMLDEGSIGDGRTRTLSEALRGLTAPAFLIGPEGGFEAQERAHLHSLGHIVPATMGPRILRAETAAVAVLATWQAVAGDWRAP